MTAIDPAAATQTPKSSLSAVWEWLNTVPAMLAVLAAAGSSVASKLLPQAAIPEPLNALRIFGVVVGIAALCVTWLLRAWLRKHVLRVFAATATLLVLLVVCYQLFVTPVHYVTTDERGTHTETVWFMTGVFVTDPTLKDLTAEDLIRKAGGGWRELRSIWGLSFDALALTYIVLYSSVMVGIVLTAGGMDFGQTDPLTAVNTGSFQAAARGKSRKNKKRR